MMQEAWGKSEEYYRDIKIQRRANCYDCFDTHEAMLCEVYFDRCMILDQSTDESEIATARSDALGLIKELKKKSKLKNTERNSGYCLNFQGRIASLDDFCNIDYGPPVNMTASYIAMMVSQAIQKEYKANSVDILMVDVQYDRRSEKEYQQYLMDKLYPNVVHRVLDTNHSESFNHFALNASSVAQKLGPQGYRTWSIHLPKQRGKSGQNKAIQKALASAIKRFGKAFYINRNAKVREEPGGHFIVRIMTKKKCKFYC